MDQLATSAEGKRLGSFTKKRKYNNQTTTTTGA
jgi:hypothetical protein